MRMLFQFVLLVFIINLVLIGLGTVTGLLIRLVFPSIELGTSVLIGLVSSISSICALIGMFVNVDRLDRRAVDWRGPSHPGDEDEQPNKPKTRRTRILPSIDLPTRRRSC
jgi:hypothetical protein